jgi:SAM-dependent methyltransferase
MNHEIDENICEPFNAGRNSARLLFDFSVMMTAVNEKLLNEKFLDFACGSGWITEFLAKMNYNVISLDISNEVRLPLYKRIEIDKRINPNLINFICTDANEMDIAENSIGHIFCFDSLHHMRDYSNIINKFFNMLVKGGRVIFAEPGLNHSKSENTIAFLKEMKLNDENWIERDVNIDEIDMIAKIIGFDKGIKIIPILHPLQLISYNLIEWNNFRKNKFDINREKYCNELSNINYYERVIFYLEK